MESILTLIEAQMTRCVCFVSRLTPAKGVYEGVETWTTLGEVTEDGGGGRSEKKSTALEMVVKSDGEQEQLTTLDGGFLTIPGNSSVVNEAIALYPGDEMDNTRKSGGSATTTTTTVMTIMPPGNQSSNLYWPLYYGDSHIEVGHPFVITCILSRDELVQWQRDGKVIGVGGDEQQAKEGDGEGAESVRIRHRGIRLDSWWGRRERAIDDGIYEDNDGIGGGRERVSTAGTTMDGSGDWTQDWRWWRTVERFMRERRNDRNDDEIVSSNGDDVDGGGGRGVVQTNKNKWTGETEESLDQLWNDLMQRIGVVDATMMSRGEGGQMERRLKRNVSELEQFKLRQYYNALVSYMNMPGVRNYYVDSVLGRLGDGGNGEMNPEQQQKQDLKVDEEEMVQETNKEFTSGYVFTQGQGCTHLIKGGCFNRTMESWRVLLSY